MALDDSPYSLFKVKKSKSVLRAKISASVEYSPYGSVATTPTNKKYPIEEINEVTILFIVYLNVVFESVLLINEPLIIIKV